MDLRKVWNEEYYLSVTDKIKTNIVEDDLFLAELTQSIIMDLSGEVRETYCFVNTPDYYVNIEEMFVCGRC